ncbi:four helix bundle protein [Dissulfurispira thermophila]|uniref:Four helix bundle protein n=1 Tax=Dissulfurispira thermophila TaxID=2715679 RepID=A0A7G1H5K6_9BACT|nr:four helix bundle protein [Dissulfurispira thermophila]BCB97392.1 four helix bundle protein [Dissulfurispira thermophila]
MEHGIWNMEYKRFEETEIWQLSKEIIVEIYKLTNEMNKKDAIFVDQMRRAALSVSNNIAEGYERNSKKELAHFLNIAKGSIGELRSLLMVSQELGLIEATDFKHLILKCEIISRQLKGFIRFLEKKT